MHLCRCGQPTHPRKGTCFRHFPGFSVFFSSIAARSAGRRAPGVPPVSGSCRRRALGNLRRIASGIPLLQRREQALPLVPALRVPEAESEDQLRPLGRYPHGDHDPLGFDGFPAGIGTFPRHAGRVEVDDGAVGGTGPLVELQRLAYSGLHDPSDLLPGYAHPEDPGERLRGLLPSQHRLRSPSLSWQVCVILFMAKILLVFIGHIKDKACSPFRNSRLPGRLAFQEASLYRCPSLLTQTLCYSLIFTSSRNLLY